MTNKIRVGIAGCGKIALVTHVPGYLKVPGVEVAALCDTDTARMDKICADHKIQPARFTNYAEMLKSGLDAVSICTPNNFHHDMTVAAARAGLHVLCEKPMAATLPEATAMIRAARKARKVLQINHSLRYHNLYVTMAELVQSGVIGTPFHVRCIRGGGKTPDKGWSPGATWFVSKAAQGGVILDIAIHMADIMKWIMGDVEKIAALTDTRTQGIDVTDNVSALFRFKKGGTGVLELSWTMPSGANLMEIYGTEGRVRQGFTADKPLELTRMVNGKPEITYPELKTGLKDSFAAFADAIRGTTPSPTPGELGRDALALCTAIARSGGNGRFVEVKTFR